MADPKLDVIIKLNDQLTKPLKGVQGEVKNTSKVMETAAKGAKILAASFVALGAGALVAGKKAVESFQAQENAEKRLLQIATQVTGATSDQIQAFKDQASALQRVGVVGDEVTIMGQSQLSSFTKSAEVVTLLTTGMLDLAVAQYGANVSQDQAIQSANMLGKALSGQLGAMTRAGILVSGEYEKAFYEANNEQERAAVLAKIVADNYGGLNEAARSTSEGGIQALKNNVGDLWEKLGEQLVPIVAKLVDWLDKLVMETIPAVVATLQGWKAEILGDVPVMEGLRAKLSEVAEMIDNKTGLVSQLRDGYAKLRDKVVNEVMPAFAEFWQALQPYMPYLEAFGKLILTGVVVALKILIEVVILVVGWFFDFSTALLKVYTWTLDKFKPAIGIMTSLLNGLQQPIQYVIDKFDAMREAAQRASEIASTALRVAQAVGTMGLSEVGRAVSGKAIGGTVTSGRPYVVGENGPEMFVPSKSGAIIPNNKMGGGGGMTIIVNGDVTGEDLINKVAKELTKRVGYSTAMV